MADRWEDVEWEDVPVSRPNQQNQQSVMGTRRIGLLENDPTDPLRNMSNPLADFNADVMTGAPFSDRAISSIKVTPQGKLSALAETYGPDNVAMRSDGEMFYRKDRLSQWTKLDEDRFSYKDIAADPLGGAIEAGPPIVAGLMTANPWAVGGSAGAGAAAREAISAMLPGDDQMTPMNRLTHIGGNTLLAGGSQLAVNKAFKLLDHLRPHNLVARSMGRAYESPFAKRGALLSDETGIQFTPGQQTGHRGALMAEGYARQNPITAEKVNKLVDIPQLEQAQKHLYKMLDKIDPQNPSPEQVGYSVQRAFNKTLDGYLQRRSNIARDDFGLVDSLSQQSKIIPVNNFRNEVVDLIERNSAPGMGDATDALVRQLKGVLKEIPEGTPMTGQQFQRLLERYGKAAKGSGQIFKDLDKGEQLFLTSRLFGALNKDLDDAIQAGGFHSSDIAAALKTARDNYRINSQPISQIEESTLGRLLGGKFDPAPEAIADKFMTMRPTQLRTSAQILKKSSPETVQQVKYHMLAKLMDDAKPSGSAQAGATEILDGTGVSTQVSAFSPAKFNTLLTKHKDQLTSGIFSPREFVDIKRTYEALGRIVNRAGTGGSQTEPLRMVGEVVRAGVGMQPDVLVKATGQGIAANKIMRAMATDRGRQALLTIANTSASTKAKTAAAVYLTGFWATEDRPSEDIIGIGQQTGQPPQQ